MSTTSGRRRSGAGFRTQRIFLGRWRWMIRGMSGWGVISCVWGIGFGRGTGCEFGASVLSIMFKKKTISQNYSTNAPHPPKPECNSPPTCATTSCKTSYEKNNVSSPTQTQILHHHPHHHPETKIAQNKITFLSPITVCPCLPA